MHMADALLSPAVATTMYAATALAGAASVRKVNKSNDASKLPTMAVTAALVFAGQMINFTIPGTGASGHICGGMLLTSLLGPEAGFLSMMVILAIQCLFFADGGLLALGANCWNMAFYGCFIGYYLIWRPIMKTKLSDRVKLILAPLLGCILTLQLGAFSVCIETTLSGVTDLPFATFVAIMQPIHLAIGAVEGLITSAILLFVYEARPSIIRDLLPRTEWDCDGARKSDRLPLVTTLIVILAAALAIGGGLSLLASSNPDGLEWSIFEQMRVNEDNYGVTSEAAQKAEIIQENLAFLPDYGFKNNDTVLGTVFSGIIGTGIVFLVFIIISMFRAPKNDNKASSALREFKDIDEMASGDTPIHKLPPLLKLLYTIIYIAAVVSFDKYHFIPLCLMAIVPIILFIVAKTKISTCFYKLRVIMPFIIMVGIFNPIIEGEVGLISMFTLMLKGVLSLMMSFILIATTPIDHLCNDLRRIHFPKVLITLLLLTYRYISVLTKEVSIMTDAYKLRAPNQSGVAPKAWGSFLGQLLLRSMDKATEIYNSMLLRGYGVNVKKGE